MWRLHGEAVPLDDARVSDFNGLHSRKRDAEVQFYAFDCLATDGDDLRKLSLRKTNLARILARRIDGIHVAPFEHGEIGPELFAAACRMELEGLVSTAALSRRPVPWLGQGEEPEPSGVQSGDGYVMVIMAPLAG
jgi:ATP-dependent DNA ligase